MPSAVNETKQRLTSVKKGMRQDSEFYFEIVVGFTSYYWLSCATVFLFLKASKASLAVNIALNWLLVFLSFGLINLFFLN